MLTSRLFTPTILFLVGGLQPVCAQNSPSSNPSGGSQTLSPSASSPSALPSGLSLSPVTVTTTLAVPLSSRSRPLSRTTYITTTFQTSETITLPSTTSTSTTAASTTSSTPSPTAPPVIHLATHIDPAFAVLGVILILTGLPSAFWGYKNRWSSFFLLGFYSFALMTCVLILKFGVLNTQNNPNPPNKKLRGLYLFASAIAGVVGGGISIFFWNTTKYLIGAWGGLALGFYIQCFHNGGLVKPIGFRWLMFIGCAMIGFILCTIPKIHYHVLLASTAAVGATAFMLGVDCFTTAGLKEFYVYNLGFKSLFPKFADIPFPVSQVMEIELGLIAAVTFMGAAVQLRVVKMLQVKMKQLSAELKKHDDELEARAADKFEDLTSEREEWEKKHGGNAGSVSLPLLAADETSTSPPDTPSQTGRPLSSVLSFGGKPLSTPVAEYFAQTSSDRPPQSPGILPAMDLGSPVKNQLPEKLISKEVLVDDHPEIRERKSLIGEIRDLRRSLDALSTVSHGTKRTRLSMGDIDTVAYGSESAVAAAAAARVVPPTAASSSGRHERHKSMIAMPSSRPLSTVAASPITRPTSTPLPDDDWNTYVAERKLFTPPSGVTEPIATSQLPEVLAPSRSERVPRSEAVTAAIEARLRRESLFNLPLTSLDTPLEEAEDAKGSGSGSSFFASPREQDLEKGLFEAPRRPERARTTSAGPAVAVQPTYNILPPRRDKDSAPTSLTRPPAVRTLTYEELGERHKSKIRALQDPISKAASKEAALAEERARWEQSVAIERQVMTKRHAQQAAEIEAKMREKEKEKQRKRTSKSPGPDDVGADGAQRHSKHRTSLSLDKLASGSGPGRMPTTVKVEEWQKYQQNHPADPSEAKKRSTHGHSSPRRG